MNETTDLTEIRGQIAALRAMHYRLSGRFLGTFTAVPEDKLDWRAAPTAKSALEIGAHVAGAHRYFLAALSGESVPHDFPGAMAWINEKASGYATREDIVKCLESSREAVDEVYENKVNPRLFSSSDDYQFAVRLPAFHTETHAGQIDYLQTCWGDQEMHFSYKPQTVD